MTDYGQPTGWTAVRTDALDALILEMADSNAAPQLPAIIEALCRVENVWRWTQNILTPGQHRTDNT